MSTNADQAAVKHLFIELAEALNNDLINKPVETTNEQPKHNKAEDLLRLYEDQKNIKYPILYKINGGIEVQLTGMSVSLLNNGRFFVNDTSGG